MNAIKTYLKDYTEVSKECISFRKKHWKGNLIVTLTVWTATFTYFAYGKQIKEKVESVFSKRN